MLLLVLILAYYHGDQNCLLCATVILFINLNSARQVGAASILVFARKNILVSLADFQPQTYEAVQILKCHF